MNIITWNVNGIRAALGKNALHWAFEKDPDALCLQEVKARPEQLSAEQLGDLKLPYIWNPAEKAGYSGVATFYKTQPDEIVMGMNEPEIWRGRARHSDPLGWSAALQHLLPEWSTRT
jgi:exodeoxyribonuclease III